MLYFNKINISQVTKKNKILDKAEIKVEPLASIQDEKESLKRK